LSRFATRDKKKQTVGPPPPINAESLQKEKFRGPRFSIEPGRGADRLFFFVAGCRTKISVFLVFIQTLVKQRSEKPRFRPILALAKNGHPQ
jgi:hypothetical protein